MSMGGGKSEDESSSMQQAEGHSTSDSAFTGRDDSSTGSSFQNDVWGGQSPYLQNLYQQAGNVFQGQQAGMPGQIDTATQHMQDVTGGATPAWQNQLQGGAYQGMDLQNQYSQLMNQGTGPSAQQDINAMIMGGEGNTYADAMKDQYIQDANRAQSNMLSNLDARAAASGMSGGSRHGVATAKGMEGINENLQRNMAQTGFGSFDKDLDRKLAIAGQADANNLARYQSQLGSLENMMGGQQGAMTGGLDQSQGMQQLGMGQFAPGMQQYNQLGAYSNILGAPTMVSSGDQFGTSTGSQDATSTSKNDWTSMGSMESDSKSSHGGIGH